MTLVACLARRWFWLAFITNEYWGVVVHIIPIVPAIVRIYSLLASATRSVIAVFHPNETIVAYNLVLPKLKHHRPVFTHMTVHALPLVFVIGNCRCHFMLFIRHCFLIFSEIVLRGWVFVFQMDALQTFMEDGDEEVLVKTFQEDMTPDERIEVVSILEKMLLFGPSKSMIRFVRLVLDSCDICTTIKCRMAELVYEADDPEYIAHIRKWIAMNDMEVACRTQWIRVISPYPNYPQEDQIQDWIQNVFCHPAIAGDAFYRFRMVMEAFQHYEKERMELFVSMMHVYKKLFDDPVMYKVTLAQSMVRKDLETPFAEGSLTLSFLTMCLDELLAVLLQKNHYPAETQADVCDFFLNTEYHRITKDHRNVAEEVMTVLFREDMTSDLSIFANRQNVHAESVEKSSQEVLEKLHEKYGLVPTHFQLVQKWRVEMEDWEVWKEMDQVSQDKTTLAMNRIVFDKKLYGKTGDTLMSIFGLVWRHIHHSDHKDELQKRLIEELMEASGQCSTGIAVRLLNTLSGFDDFMLTISYRESILAKVMNHMNRAILSVEDETLQDKLLTEMILPHDQYMDRQNFLDLFRKEVPTIKENLYEEFKDFVSDTDFDLFLRQAILHYEGY